jgi:formate hydrogenlyase subunit 3/multisubunit Na+/H+ antiporter MnhD subunit
MTELALPAPATLLPLAVLLPLGLGIAAFLLPGQAQRWLLAPGWLAMAALVVALAAAGDAPLHYALGGWHAPLGIELYADRLTQALLLLALVVYAAVLPYAHAYFGSGESDVEQARLFWPLAWMLWAALNAAFLSADLFNLYVALELLGLCAVGLTAISGRPAALAAALRYLLAALLAANLFLLGVALLYGSTGVLALAGVAAALSGGAGAAPHAALAMVLIAIALALKSALAPLHYWLPAAHGGAVTPVSALLSALVVKASLAILLRLWLHLAPAVDLERLGLLLAGLGAVAILWGSVLALVQQRIKMLVAYSTVAQVGYLFLPYAWLLPGAPGAALALEAGVLQLVAHGLAKAAMFLAAGVLVWSAGRDELAALAGAAARQPVALFAFGLAGVSLIGLPPSVGFTAKWQMLHAALAAGQWPWVLLLLAGGLLTAAYVFRVLRLGFLPAAAAGEARPVAGAMPAAALALALLAALGGLFVEPLRAAFDAGSLLAAGSER